MRFGPTHLRQPGSPSGRADLRRKAQLCQSGNPPLTRRAAVPLWRVEIMRVSYLRTVAFMMPDGGDFAHADNDDAPHCDRAGREQRKNESSAAGGSE